MDNEFQCITNSVREAIILVDQKARVTYWNPMAENIFGYTTKEAIGKSIHTLVVPRSMGPEGKARIGIGVKAFSETGVGYFTIGKVELVGRRKNETEFPVELSISPMIISGKWSAVGLVKDITERKQAEKKLREAEERYHALFDQSPLGVLIVNPETAAFIEFNDVAHQQLGYSRSEFEKLTIQNIEASESFDEIRVHMNQMIQGGGGEFESKHLTKQGEIRNVLVTTKKIELEGKKFLHCIFHDITETRRIQDSLIESERSYRQLVELAQEGIWALNAEFTTVFVNPRMAKMLGYAESEMVGKNLFDFIIDDKRKDAFDYFTNKNHEFAGNYEYELLRKDSTKINVSIEASPMKDDYGNFIGNLALVADITERKQMEQTLRESEEKFRAISNSVSDALILVDDDAKISFWSPSAEKIFGYTRSEALGKEAHELIVPQIYAGGMKVIRERIIKFGKTGKGKIVGKTVELIARKKNGCEFPIKISISAMPLKGKWYGVALARDITEQKQTRKRLEEYSTRLEMMVAAQTDELKITHERLLKAERLAAIGELAGMVGHDLRNPLAGVKNAAYFLEKKGCSISDAQSVEMFKIIKKCIDHSNRIINDLLDYSKEIHLERGKISLEVLLADALSMIQVPEKVSITSNLAVGINVNVDVDKIERVFVNLVKNAIDAMPIGGTISIASKEKNGNLEISFSDTGEGISDEILPKLFMPLITSKAQGMGFGLAICKRIIEAHGGNINVATAKGKGTTFIVTLPIVQKIELEVNANG